MHGPGDGEKWSLGHLPLPGAHGGHGLPRGREAIWARFTSTAGCGNSEHSLGGLDAMAARAADAALAVVEPIVSDASLGAVDKLNAVFAASTTLKVRERALILTFLRVLYHDRNLRLRKRIEDRNAAKIAPLVARIIRQGIDQGELDVAEPEDAATLLLGIGSALTERIASEAVTAADGIGPGSIRIIEADVARILVGEEMP